MATEFDRVLIVEDDTSLSYFLSRCVYKFSTGVKVCSTATSAFEELSKRDYNLVVLDIGLPDSNGFKLLYQIRERYRNLPVIVITSFSEVEIERRAFIEGANLFHRKPINFDLLAAQIKSLLKNYGVHNLIEVGDLTIDPNRRLVSKQGQEINLSFKEYELITQLAYHRGEVLTREQLIHLSLRSNREISPSSIDTLVSRARRKVGNFNGKPIIETVHGRGFRLNLAYLRQA